MNLARFDLEDPPFAGFTGRGISVAVIDSGIHEGNPHITCVSRGVHITATGVDEDAVDRLGHGTAVAAAILEKAPGVDLVAVRVFEHALATSAAVLAHAIEWAVDQNCRLINLSLGTPKLEHEAVLREAVERACAQGSVIVSAWGLDGRRWLPGSIAGVAGVLLDPNCPRDELRMEQAREGTIFRASDLPRPIAGVPIERNVRGVSFAVANTTGFLARLLEAEPHLQSVQAVHEFLADR